MKRHLPAGDAGDDRKAIREELIEAKLMLSKLDETRANKARENMSEKVQDVKNRINEKIDEHKERRSA